MKGIAFSCPWCDQRLKASHEMSGQLVACPSCRKKVQVPEPTPVARPSTYRVQHECSEPRFPIIIRASTRALYAEYVWRAIRWTFGLAIAIAATWFLIKGPEPAAPKMIAAIWAIFLVLLLISLTRLWLDYRRIKHTEYWIFPNKIEATSYLFRFLGAYNNVVNLAQLRQIRASVNSLLDLWFFKCGRVTLTVSGDVADFELRNVYQPSLVRKQIEEVAFGKESVQYGPGPVPEIAEE